ncbi:hypothetical protein B0H13DRAFT_179586 [Mycena leptocephala]|nr:hypothetical protein B0H13DRAFT_179586 [Mycena leptocephala]
MNPVNIIKFSGTLLLSVAQESQADHAILLPPLAVSHGILVYSRTTCQCCRKHPRISANEHSDTTDADILLVQCVNRGSLINYTVINLAILAPLPPSTGLNGSPLPRRANVINTGPPSVSFTFLRNSKMQPTLNYVLNFCSGLFSPRRRAVIHPK